MDNLFSTLRGLFPKHVLFLLLLTTVAFANTLTHDFCGDDHVIIVRNTFYSSLSNLPRLFSRSYSTDANNAILYDEPDKGSGSVAYRPVLSLTYFLDFFIWGRNSFGFHLTNLLLHLFNVTFVYFLFSKFFKDRLLVFWATLFFAIHPIQSEAVSAIGFRADLLFSLWCLLAFFSWSFYETKGRQIYQGFALLFYGLALFSKETAFLFPVCLVYVDFLKGIDAKRILHRISPFIFLAMIYLVVYFVLFPNTAIDGDLMQGVSFSHRLSSLSQIWFQYFLFFVCPFMVKSIPTLYFPVPGALFLTVAFWLLLFLCIIGVYLVRRFSTREKPYTFFLLWFVLFFMPASGLVVNPNPAGLRYLYFSGIGIYCFLGVLTVFFMRFPPALRMTSYWPRFLAFFGISCCLIFLYLNTIIWKNNISAGRFWADEFPEFYKGHYVYAVELFSRGAYLEAIEHYRAAVNDPRFAGNVRILNDFARAYLAVGRYEEARVLYKQLIKHNPQSSFGYNGMARYHRAKKNFTLCRLYLQQAVRVEPTKANYLSLINSAVETRDQVLLSHLSEDILEFFSGNISLRDSLLGEVRRHLEGF